MKKSIIAIGLAALTLQGCYSDITVRERAPLMVETIEVSKPVEQQYREFRGQVVTAEQTKLSFRIQGEIAHLLVKPGQSVKKGQVVAKLDDKKLQQQYRDALAQYELATKQLRRGAELYSREMISSSELDELTSNRQLTKAQYQNIQHQIQYTSLKAPFAGVVAEVDKERFENVGPGETVVSIYQDDKVYVKISLSDHILASITPQAQRDAYEPRAFFSGQDKSYTMEYLEHSSEPDAVSRAYELWLQMPQPDAKILPGTSVSVHVDMVAAGLSTIQGYQLPMTVLEAGNQPSEFFVWKHEEGVATKAPVRVDQVNSFGVIVDSGVSQGDILISSSLRKLRDGEAVALMENNK
ncbi:efflux RND transporter periplasmic adaptor subunit [Vibrio sp. SCSIO 43140]|uniref:efflux RND transporter periplasmic adaptor subunit n=1 Tax=Vibrio sp. SCSIO 43140 TaxID=2819100 RepID=UPI002074BC02|nr:efflux RND transporter periplasmic adaptor subunit [Vibrio sp. SCSIO 43140]USD62968.1 efflux RND transporter periplasmic adaptor subunit [Vibrio sp. SCSIO 43140]